MKGFKEGRKKLKKMSYIGKTVKFKRMLCFMLAWGVFCSALYAVKYIYNEYPASRANMVLTFPQIAMSEYPDESRFTYYDFISDERLEEALEAMQKKGLYSNYTVDDLRDRFYIYSMMESSASSAVSSARSEGNDFSYVSNEYKITYIQPHDKKEKNIFKRAFMKDYSEEFLNVLVQVNRDYIANELGGSNAFEKMTRVDNTEHYDYSEKTDVYRTKINAVRSYLKYLSASNPDFVYEKENLTLKDIESRYSFLITNSLDGISDFVESSGISKDLEQTANKLNVNIENNTLKFNKQWDRSKNNLYAIENYDQTFTENLINVIKNEEYGLYQARPKTAFDTVVVQKHIADENVAIYSSQITKLKNDLAIYGAVEESHSEHDRLVEKYETLMEGFEKEYNKLSEIANKVVRAYFNDKNEEYIEAKIKPRNVFSKTFAVKCAVVFTVMSVLMFVLETVWFTLKDMRELSRRKKMIEAIRKASDELGE